MPVVRAEIAWLFGRNLGAMQRDMSGRGFALARTPRFFDAERAFRLKTTIALRRDSKHWAKYPQLGRYAAWLEALVTQALPEESATLTVLEYRYEGAGTTDQTVDRLHADGSYIRSVFTLCGPTTIYREGLGQFSVPHGQTLIMTAMGRARTLGIPCTLHRRPGPGSERAVIVCSFEPSPAGDVQMPPDALFQCGPGRHSVLLVPGPVKPRGGFMPVPETGGRTRAPCRRPHV
jgi:hypothetical protein